MWSTIPVTGPRFRSLTKNWTASHRNSGPHGAEPRTASYRNHWTTYTGIRTRKGPCVFAPWRTYFRDAECGPVVHLSAGNSALPRWCHGFREPQLSFDDDLDWFPPSVA